MYPALAVLERLNADFEDVHTLWVGSEGGMERDLVTKAGVDYISIPAAGIHGVGIHRLPRNGIQIIRGLIAARRVIKKFKPDQLFFTGGYVAVPMALAGLQIPTLLYVPDIEPGMALKYLARLANCIALTAEESKQYFPIKKKMVVTGYPVRAGLSAWEKDEAYRIFDLTPQLPTLLVTGGSLGSLSINNAITKLLPKLLKEMQIIHLTGKATWSQFEHVRETLSFEDAQRYRSYPYLYEKMGAAYTVSDLVISRAGASTLGEYPEFGIPAILVPYPYAWRYQKVNADYLVGRNAAVLLEDSEMHEKLLPLITGLMEDHSRRQKMKEAMRKTANRNSTEVIAKLIIETTATTSHVH